MYHASRLATTSDPSTFATWRSDQYDRRDIEEQHLGRKSNAVAREVGYQQARDQKKQERQDRIFDQVIPVRDLSRCRLGGIVVVDPIRPGYRPQVGMATMLYPETSRDEQQNICRYRDQDREQKGEVSAHRGGPWYVSRQAAGALWKRKYKMRTSTKELKDE